MKECLGARLGVPGYTCLVAPLDLRPRWAGGGLDLLNHLAVGHPEFGHPVQDPAADPGLDSLRCQPPWPHRRTEHLLVSVEERLNLGALAVARLPLPGPLADPELRGDVAIPLARRRRRWGRESPLSGWYEHSWLAVISVPFYRIVDSLGVVGRVGRDRCQRTLDLLE